MKNATAKTLILAALLVPAASAFAASDDPFSGYQRGIAGTTASPAQASSLAAAACSSDPFTGYRQAFNAGGPVQVCGDMGSGAQGPAGPTMASAWSDPFEGYNHGIAGK